MKSSVVVPLLLGCAAMTARAELKKDVEYGRVGGVAEADVGVRRSILVRGQ